MENVTTSSATVPDGIRIGVCGLVGALYLSASIVTVTFNGLLLYVMFKDPLKCFRRPLSVYMTRLAMTDFLFGSVLDPPFSKNRILLCQLQRRGNNFLPHHPLFYRQFCYRVDICRVSWQASCCRSFNFLPLLRREHSRGHFHCLRLVLLHGVQFNSAGGRRWRNLRHDGCSFVCYHCHNGWWNYLPFHLSHFPQKKKSLSNRTEETSQKDEKQIRRLNSKKELAFTAFLILLALVITQIPYLVMTVIEANCQSCTETTWFFVCHEFADFLLCLSAIANPYLYGWRVKQSRDSLMAVFCRSRLEPVDLEIPQNTKETRNQR